MSVRQDLKASEGQVSSFAYKVLQRLHALGAKSHTLDDVKQELWIAWCLARDTYSEEGGASFRTYLHTGMQRHINRYIEKNFERFHGFTTAISLDAPASRDEDNGITVGEVVPCSAVGAEELYMQRRNLELAKSMVSPRARIFLTILNDQPPELMAEVLLLVKKAEYGRGINMGYAQPVRLTAAMIFDLMNAGRMERTRILSEVTKIGDRISRQQ